MKGLDLSRIYFEEVGLPALESACPGLRGRLAAGLVGEGSECLGYDDALSRDHDWGPGFCLWLTGEDLERFGVQARKVYDALPREYLGVSRLREDPMSAGRVGVFSVERFYRRFLGRATPPETAVDWLVLSEQALSVCTNGAVFRDDVGAFTAFRETLLSYYPEDVWRKRLAARCALAAQAGQYNFPRCLQRGDRVAALRALAEFIDHAQAALFLLNRRYRPYYKWAHRALRDLPLAGRAAEPLFQSLTEGALEERTDRVEAISALIIRLLGEQGLSQEDSDFLLPHAKAVQAGIRTTEVRELPLMTCL